MKIKATRASFHIGSQVTPEGKMSLNAEKDRCAILHDPVCGLFVEGFKGAMFIPNAMINVVHYDKESYDSYKRQELAITEITKAQSGPTESVDKRTKAYKAAQASQPTA